MKYTFFDFEVYPHWWCMVWQDWDSCDDMDIAERLSCMRENKGKYMEQMNYVTSEDKNAKKVVFDALTQNVATGYNIRHYDLLIAEAIFRDYTPEQVREVNDDIIVKNSCSLFVPSFITYQDLRDDTAGSLKEKEGLLGLDIIEAPFTFDKEVLSEHDKSKLIDYCSNDVYSEMYYFFAIAKTYIETKLKIAEMFTHMSHKSVFESTNSKLVCAVLARQDSKPSEEHFEFKFPEAVEHYIHISFAENEKLLTNVLNNTAGETFSEKMFDNMLTFGDGGLHSVLSNNLCAESDSEYMIMNFDAEAYYPSLMLAFGIMPSNMDEERFRGIVKERLRLKHEKGANDDEKRAIKILCNTVYGMMGNKYSQLYAPEHRSFVCRLGQLLIASLAEHLYRYVDNLSVLQINTDSIMCMFPRCGYSVVSSTVHAWEELTDVSVSSEEIKRIWQKDVNNYLLTRPSGAVKTRGAWLCGEFFNVNTQCLRSPVAPVCARAAVSWLVRNSDPIAYIRNCEDLEMFAIPCSKGSSYDALVRSSTRFRETDLGRFARVYASKNANIGGVFRVKYEDHDGRKEKKLYRVPNTPDSCAIINGNPHNMPFSITKRDIDYMFYFRRLRELLGGKWYELVAGEMYETKLYNGGGK